MFSVSQSHADAVVEYIRRQEEHHRAQSFTQEVLRLYTEEQLPLDERFVWD